MRSLLALIDSVYFFVICAHKQRMARAAQIDDVLYTTADGTEIRVYRGIKSEFDFKVAYKAPGKRERTPRHLHLIVELYVKHAYDPDLTLQMKHHILEMFKHVKPVSSYPPQLQFFRPEHVEPFRSLDAVGEFTVEFLLITIELIAIQEITNYPSGTLTESVYRDFGLKDRFSVIHTAAWSGRRR